MKNFNTPLETFKEWSNAFIKPQDLANALKSRNPTTTLIFPEEVISREESFQIQGMGGCVGLQTGESMTYKLTMPPDFPYGIEPDSIIDNSSTFANFYKTIDIMASESQVLILIHKLLLPSEYKNACCHIVNDLEKNSYIVHPLVDKDGNSYPQNEEAGKWVRAHQPQIKKNMASCVSEQKKKYLIGDWYSSAGYEVPAVIFVTPVLDQDPRKATYCQRAKAKLVIYHLTNSRFH